MFSLLLLYQKYTRTPLYPTKTVSKYITLFCSISESLHSLQILPSLLLCRVKDTLVNQTQPKMWKTCVTLNGGNSPTLLSLCLGYIIKYLKYLSVCYYMFQVWRTKTLLKRRNYRFSDTHTVNTIKLHTTYLPVSLYEKRAFVLNFIQDEESYHPNFSSDYFRAEEICG